MTGIYANPTTKEEGKGAAYTYASGPQKEMVNQSRGGWGSKLKKETVRAITGPALKFEKRKKTLTLP